MWVIPAMGLVVVVALLIALAQDLPSSAKKLKRAALTELFFWRLRFKYLPKRQPLVSLGGLLCEATPEERRAFENKINGLGTRMGFNALLVSTGEGEDAVMDFLMLDFAGETFIMEAASGEI